MLHATSVTHSTYEVKKSTFTSYLLPYSLFKDYHDKLKTEHPKASHIIWAFRYLNDMGQVVEGGSDDGEPKGVAATPTLNVLRGEDMINSALLTVRYFGGTKLGTGGMVRAYTQSAKSVICDTTLEPYIAKEIFTLTTPYTLSKRYEHFFDTHDILYHDRTFEVDEIVWRMRLSQKEKILLENFTTSLG